MSIHTHAAPAAAHHEVRRTEGRRADVRRERPVVRIAHRELRTVRARPRYERTVVRPIVRPVIRPVVRSVYVAPASYWTPTPAYTVAPQPIQLLSPTSLASDQLSIDTGGSLGAATALELDTAGGSTYVSQVTLVDAYGGTQALPVNQVLSAANPSIQLPLSSGSSIVRVIIDGHSDWGGQLAMRAL